MSSLLIKSVNLTNYKIFSEKFVEFKRGINLLVGINGAGKSTIIEAIAFAMFDSNIKSFKKPDFIKIGEKKATIEVIFVGIDGIEYRVERILGSSPKHLLYQNGATSPLCESTAHVIEKIGALTGVTENAKTVFENIIFAGQNKITEIFLYTEAKRVELFNKIFNLGIYREMYDSSLKNCNDKLEHVVSKNSGALEKVIELIVDKKELAEELKIAKKEKETIEKEVAEIAKQRDTKKEYIEFINQKIAKKKLLLQNRSVENSRLEENGASIVREQNSIDMATKAKEIVEQNIEPYHRFLQLQQEAKKIAIEIKVLEGFVEQLERKKSDLHRKETDKQKLISDSELFASKTKDLTALVQELEDTLATDSDALSKEKQALDTVIENGKMAREVTESCKPFIEKIDGYRKKIEEYNHKINFTKESVKEIDSNSVSTLIAAIELLKTKQIKRDEIQSHCNKVISRLEELTAAEKELSQGLCPILKEGCKNVESTSGGSYFSDRAKELTSQKVLIEKELAEYIGINEQLINKNSELNILQKEIKNNEDKKRDLETFTLHRELVEKDISLSENELSSILVKAGYNDDIYESYKKVESKIQLLQDEYRTKNGYYTTNLARVKELEAKLQSTKKEIEKQNKLIRSIAEKIEVESQLIEAIKAEIVPLEESIVPLASTKEKKESVDNQLTTLQPQYNLYMKNIELVKELDNHITILQKLQENKTQIEHSIVTLSTDIAQLEKEVADIDISLLEKELLEQQKEFAQKEKAFNDANRVFITITNRVAENTSRIQEKKRLEAELSIHKKRVEIGNSFRKMVRNLGVKVSEKYLQIVSVDASAKFNEITGRNEKIEWREGYELFLVNSENDKRSFNQLSGGEQVAVAISVRAALLKQLSSAQFAFFDEPTNNLDVERKELLAQSIDKIMSGLNQVIIVTHDNNFETMAEWVVEV